MPKVGDVCETCRDRWENRKMEPKTLVEAAGTTEKKHFKVPICPYCDGDAATVAEANREG